MVSRRNDWEALTIIQCTFLIKILTSYQDLHILNLSYGKSPLGLHQGYR